MATAPAAVAAAASGVDRRGFMATLLSAAAVAALPASAIIKPQRFAKDVVFLSAGDLTMLSGDTLNVWLGDRYHSILANVACKASELLHAEGYAVVLGDANG